jgi:excisionase family DNA binding protein
MDQKDTSERLLTSHEVGALLQVDPTSVAKWVDQGRIAAFRTPGGHRRIRAADLVEFLESHQMPVPGELRRVLRRRLLIVDDKEPQLRALGRLLKPYRDKIDVALVDNGIDALVQVGAFKPHLVVLDVFMPEVDGLDVCRRLKANPETEGIDVIIASAQLTADVRDRALAAGARVCLAKPINLTTVLEALGVAQTAAP